MKSFALINDKDIDTIKMALNDAISDMNTELKQSLPEKKRVSVLEYKYKYTRVLDKLRQNPSIYALAEGDIDIAAGGLNDAVDLLDENISDDLTDQEKQDILEYKNDCLRLVEILAG